MIFRQALGPFPKKHQNNPCQEWYCQLDVSSVNFSDSEVETGQLINVSDEQSYQDPHCFII